MGPDPMRQIDSMSALRGTSGLSGKYVLDSPAKTEQA
jgi:hypothetical protein